MDNDSESIKRHYKTANEKDRLHSGIGLLEFTRMKELMSRFIPDPPATIGDIGGGTGEYSFWLASQGYHVHLIDLVPEHLEWAKERADNSSELNPIKILQGDARAIPYGDEYFDAVLLAGPMYHLTNREDRMKALREAYRILRPNGIAIINGISRFASLMAGLMDGRLYLPDFMKMLRVEIPTGLHVRCTSNDPSASLERAFFHLPGELAEEIREAGMNVEDILGVIGPAWMAKDFDESWRVSKKREAVLEIARLTEFQPELGPYIMAVATKAGKS